MAGAAAVALGASAVLLVPDVDDARHHLDHDRPFRDHVGSGPSRGRVRFVEHAGAEG